MTITVTRSNLPETPGWRPQLYSWVGSNAAGLMTFGLLESQTLTPPERRGEIAYATLALPASSIIGRALKPNFVEAHFLLYSFQDSKMIIALAEFVSLRGLHLDIN